MVENDVGVEVGIEDAVSITAFLFYFRIQCLVVCTLLVCDFCQHIAEDYILSFKMQWTWPTWLYWIGRLSTAAFEFYVLVLIAQPFTMSQSSLTQRKFRIVETALCSICLASLSALFLIRLRAVAHDHPYIKRIATALYVATALATSVSTFIDASRGDGESITATTKVMIPWGLVIPFFIWIVYDTSVIVVMTWKLVGESHYIPPSSSASPESVEPSGRPKATSAGAWKAVFTANGLQRLSARLLRDGQFYYSLTLLLNIVYIALITQERTRNHGALFTVYSAPALNCIVTCKVFRDLKLESRLREWRLGGASSMPAINFRTIRETRMDPGGHGVI